MGTLTWIETPDADPVRITQDGAFYLVTDFCEDPISPPLASRAAATDLRSAIYALAESDPERYRAILRGRVPAPGAAWLIGGGGEVRP